MDVHDARFDPRARQEALATVRAMPDQHMVEVMTVQQQESMRATSNLRRGWEEDWRLYQNDIAWNDKEEWQSTVWIPMPWQAVEQATAIIQRSMLDSPDFFGLDGWTPREKTLATKVWGPALKQALHKTSFIPKFADATKIAFATGIGAYFKIRYSGFAAPTLAGMTMDPVTGEPSPIYEPQLQRYLNLELVPPWQVYRDHRSRAREPWSGSFILQEEFVDQAWLGARRGRLENLDQVREGTSRTAGGRFDSPEQQERRRGQTAERHRFRKEYRVREWYGDVLDENGEVVFPDAMAMDINETLVIRPQETPLWAVDTQSGRRKWPLVAFSAISHPMRFEGFSILRAVTPLAVLLSNLFNLYTDGLNWAVNPATEVDLSVLEDWSDLEHYPGKLWRKNGSAQALRPAQIGSMDSATVLHALQYIDQQFQNNSFVTAFVTGQPGTRSNITKGEVEIKTQQSMGVFDAIARNLEAGGAALVEVIFDTLHQHLSGFSAQPNLVALLGEEQARWLDQLHPIERMQALGGNFQFHFTGVSTALQKSQLLGRLMQASTIAANDPYRGYTNPQEVLQALVDVLGVRDRIHVSDRPMVPVHEIPMLLQSGQLDAMLAGQGGEGPALGPTPRPPSMRDLAPTRGEVLNSVG
jgi:hypothetical protein